MAMLAALILPSIPVSAEPAQAGPRAGDLTEIRMEYATASESSGGSESSSSGRDVILERVIAVREDGLELEFDLPEETSDRKALDWQFPVRVFRPHQGPMQLLNRAQLEARIDQWLKKAKWTREVCGRSIFTWNVFKIECDPQSVIETLEYSDLRAPDLREGAPYKHELALAAAPLSSKPAGPGLTAEMKLDADAVRRKRAESDLVVAEISGKTLTLEDALRARAAESVSGTIRVTFDTNSEGRALRRTTVAEMETRAADGELEKATSKQTVERRIIRRGD